MQYGSLFASTSADVTKLLAFYEANPHPYLVPRPRGELADAISDGRFYFVEIDGSIEAAAGCFTYDANLPIFELSDTRVLRSVGGFGLQSLFHRLRIAHVVVNEASPKTLITAAIDPGNTRSRENATDLGFVLWTQSIPNCVYASCPGCPRRGISGPRPCCCDHFVAPLQAQRAAVSGLLGRYENSKLVLRRDEAKLLKRFSEVDRVEQLELLKRELEQLELLELTVECRLLRSEEHREAARCFIETTKMPWAP